MKKKPVNKADITVFAHATEDQDKVRLSVINILPKDMTKTFEEISLTGYYGDPITLMTTKLRRWKDATETLVHIVNALSSLDQQSLLDGTENRVDGSGNLYIRLDKQKALKGRIVLSSNDPIRGKFKFFKPHGVDPVEHINEFLREIIQRSGDDGA